MSKAGARSWKSENRGSEQNSVSRSAFAVKVELRLRCRSAKPQVAVTPPSVLQLPGVRSELQEPVVACKARSESCGESGVAKCV